MGEARVARYSTTSFDGAEESACRDAFRLLQTVGAGQVEAQREVWAAFYPRPFSGKRRGRPPKGGWPTPDKDPYAVARALCDVCPVSAACLEHTLETRDTVGFRAGFEPAELDAILDADAADDTSEQQVAIA